MHIVLDVGGTKIRAARAEISGPGEISKIATPHEPNEMIEAIAGLVRDVAKGETVTGVSGGIPGIVRDGVIAWEPPHLAQWIGCDIAGTLKGMFNVPVAFANDTAIVGLGEAHWGGGKGSKICVYYTISTGVGSVRIVDGSIDRATFGFEAGHQIVEGGELEAQISGTAVAKKFGINPWELDSLDERNKLADILAEGLFNSILHWSPDTIVLGGSMIVGKNPIPIERVEQVLNERLASYPGVPAIRKAELGDNGGLYGGISLLSGLHSATV